MVFEGAWSEYSTAWQHADWSQGFRCGAYNQPTHELGFQEITLFSFPALFSPWNISAVFPNDRFHQQPHAYLCYAKRAHSCAATTTYGRDGTQRFEEMIACPGVDASRSELSNSAWRFISGPLPISRSVNVATFSAGRGSDGDCAEIRLHDEDVSTGAQVVFALECNVSAPGGLDIACPKDNQVRLSVDAGFSDITKDTLLVSPTANMTIITERYRLDESRMIHVQPDSTLVFIADLDSSLTSITLCFY